MKYAWVLLFTFFLFGCSSPEPEDLRNFHVQVFWRGVYSADYGQESSGDDQILSIRGFNSPPLLGEESHKVPLRLGTRFGALFQVMGYPRGAVSTLTTKVIFPQPGMRSKSGELEKGIARTFLVKVGAYGLLGIQMNSWDNLLPGTWRFEIWSGEDKLTEEVFSVEEP